MKKYNIKVFDINIRYIRYTIRIAYGTIWHMLLHIRYVLYIYTIIDIKIIDNDYN